MAIITTGNSFNPTDTVTSVELNNIANAATFDEPVDGTSLELKVDGKLGIKNAGVTFAKLTDVIDDDTMATASATKLATSSSIKSYVDTSANPYSKIKRTSSTAQLSVTSVITLDDTIPSISEGLEILSTTFTAFEDSNKLIIRFDGLLVGSTAGMGIVLSLFRGNTCVGAQWWSQPSNGAGVTNCSFLVDPLTTTSQSYSLRYGPGAAGFIAYANIQSNQASTLGGLQEISMTIQEVQNI